MSDHMSLLIAPVVLVALGADLVLLQGETALFLARRMSDLVEYLAFWR